MNSSNRKVTFRFRVLIRAALLSAALLIPCRANSSAVQIELENAKGSGETVSRFNASKGKTRKLAKMGESIHGEFSSAEGAFFAKLGIAHRSAEPCTLRLQIDGETAAHFTTTAAKDSSLVTSQSWNDVFLCVSLSPIHLKEGVHSFSLTVIECDRWSLEADVLILDPEKPRLPEYPIRIEAEKPGRAMPRSAASGFGTRPMKPRELCVLSFVAAGGPAELFLTYSLDAQPCKVEILCDSRPVGSFLAISTTTAVQGGGWNDFNTGPGFPVTLEEGAHEVIIRGLWPDGFEVDYIEFRPAAQSPSSEKATP